MQDWSSPSPLPMLTISSLGSTIKFQGTFTIRQWKDLQAEVRRLGRPENRSRIEAYIERLRQGSVSPIDSVRPKVQAVLSEEPQSISVVSIAEARFPEGVLRYVSGAKLIYAKGCIASVSVALDEATPYAVSLVDKYLAEVKVQ